ncbi:MAG: glycoside hydrolase family 3 N-terminal domain-containing protein, partial [Bacteroidales bacterium]
MKFKHINSCFYAMILLMMSCKGSEKTSVGSSGFESKIDSIVAEMTLEEKIGQMTQLTLDVIGKGNSVYESTIPFTFDEAMLDTVFNIYKVGSILNAPSNTPQTVDEWAKIIKTIQERGIKATGIPVMYGADEIHGTTYTVGGTLFPQQVAMGATFNRALVQQGSEICAYETKASNIPWNFSPVLDLGRNPSWSRMWETYGEDAYLVSEMGAASVLGYQGSDP